MRPAHRLLSVSACALGSLALVTHCGDGKPKLAAEGTGDLTYSLGYRVVADAELKVACGDGAMVGDGTALRRRPYLQDVTERTARVLFTSSRKPPFAVELNKAGKTAVESYTAQQDESAVLDGEYRQFEAKLDGLEPDTVYCYRVAGVTEPAGFRTAPVPGSSDTIRFAVIGDSGTGDSFQRAVADQLQSVPYEFLLHLGDLAYGSGQPNEIELNYFDVYRDLTRSFAVYPIAGNHDYKTAAAAPFFGAFALPENAPPERAERFYSFDRGAVHFVALDTELMDAQQAAWLDADLANTNASWIIVYAHRPPYSSGEHGGSSTFRNVFGPILERHRVALVLSGHEHDYERTQPINGITYVVSGGGGRDTRSVSSSWFTAYSEDVLHIVFIEVSPDELVLHAIDGVGREFDSARLERRRPDPVAL
jgi:acid phosphatase type 7